MLALAHFLGLILQTMSARLGVVTGKNLARVRDVGFVCRFVGRIDPVDAPTTPNPLHIRAPNDTIHNQVCREQYGRKTYLALWVLVELAIIGCDLQEIVGSAIAFQILFGFPLWLGCLITFIDTFTFLMIHYWGVRKLEGLFIVLVATMVRVSIKSCISRITRSEIDVLCTP